MIKAQLVFVPPGGGEVNYRLDFELPGVPRPGDHISIRRPETSGSFDFKVRRSWRDLHYPDNASYRVVGVDPEIYGSLKQLTVECEFALGVYSCDEHKRECQNMKGISHI